MLFAKKLSLALVLITSMLGLAKESYAGNITGTVTDTAGNPLENIGVTAFHWIGWWEVVNSDSTDAAGNYDIDALDTENYRVRFEDSSGTYALEHYDDALDIDHATNIAVTAGTTTPNINAQLALAAHITGTVTDSAGNPLGNIGVIISRWNGSGWDWIGEVLTEPSSGNYEMGGLNSGTYHLEFRDQSGTYIPEYYDDAPTQESARDIVITVGTTTPNINAQLALAGRITGTVTDTAGNPLWNINVAAYRWNGSWWSQVNNVSTDTVGHYDLGSLTTASYRVGFTSP